MKGKYLITTDNWFVAPDGNTYQAVWGEIEIVEDSFLGLKTNRMSTNWFAKIGSQDNHVIVAGCQIHYAVKCKERPSDSRVTSWQMDAKDYNEASVPSRIYFTN